MSITSLFRIARTAIVALPVLIASAPEPARWAIAGLAIIAGWLLLRAALVARQVEQRAAGDSIIDALIESAAAVRRARSRSRDLRR